MKTTSESDIPQLFRQFSGNSATYQELTRAAAARASQARWPLLSAVELERGDIPAVIDPETGLAVLETTSLQARADADDAAAVPVEVLTDIIPDTAPTTVDILAQSNDESVKLSKAEILALVDIEANYPPKMPVPVIVPGTNTIFIPPAPFGARHFAQVERALAARREAATGGIPLQADVAAAPLSDIPAKVELTEASTEQWPATSTTPSDAAVDTLAALNTELAAAQPQEAAAPVVEIAKVETPPEAAAQAAPAKPVSPPASQTAASVAALPETKAAEQFPLRAFSPSTAAPRPLAAASDASPVKHAGLKPLFERLAASEETASPVKSLFSRLLQS